MPLKQEEQKTERLNMDAEQINEQIPGSVYRKDWVMYIGRPRNRSETRLSCEGIRSLSDSIRISTRSGKTNPGYASARNHKTIYKSNGKSSCHCQEEGRIITVGV